MPEDLRHIVITRKRHESIMIKVGDQEIEITAHETHNSWCRIMLACTDKVQIVRRELYEQQGGFRE